MIILRYTIGDVSNNGFKIIQESIHYIKKIYPEFDIIICHNNLKIEQLDFLKKLNVPLYAQKHERLEQKPYKECWKLYPPRLSIDNYEIVMDNDVLITKRIPQIDEFLSSNKTLLMSAVYRAYGQFEKHISKDLYINCGIYGMPPKFDLENKIKELSKDIKYWSNRFDDQGLIAYCLGNAEHIIIPMTSILPLGENSIFRSGLGYHFIDANSIRLHSGWEGYLTAKNNLF